MLLKPLAMQLIMLFKMLERRSAVYFLVYSQRASRYDQRI